MLPSVGSYVPGNCGTLDDNVKTALDDALGNLPWSNEDDRGYVDDWDGIVPLTLLPGLTLGRARLRDLHGLRPDRPYQTFCKGNEKVVLFHLRSDWPLSLHVAWKLWGEYQGRLYTEGRVEYEGEVSIVNTTDSEKTELILNALRPVMVRYVSIHEYEVHFVFRWTVTVLSYVFQVPLQTLWLDHVSDQVRNVLEKKIATVYSEGA